MIDAALIKTITPESIEDFTKEIGNLIQDCLAGEYMIGDSSFEGTAVKLLGKLKLKESE